MRFCQLVVEQAIDLRKGRRVGRALTRRRAGQVVCFASERLRVCLADALVAPLRLPRVSRAITPPFRRSWRGRILTCCRCVTCCDIVRARRSYFPSRYLSFCFCAANQKGKNEYTSLTSLFRSAEARRALANADREHMYLSADRKRTRVQTGSALARSVCVELPRQGFAARVARARLRGACSSSSSGSSCRAVPTQRQAPNSHYQYVLKLQKCGSAAAPLRVRLRLALPRA